MTVITVQLSADRPALEWQVDGLEVALDQDRESGSKLAACACVGLSAAAARAPNRGSSAWLSVGAPSQMLLPSSGGCRSSADFLDASPVQDGREFAAAEQEMQQATESLTAVAQATPPGSLAAAEPTLRDPQSRSSLGPAWTRGEIEAPAGTKEMGAWKAAVYTPEQQMRLAVDEQGAAPPSLSTKSWHRRCKAFVCPFENGNGRARGGTWRDSAPPA